MKFLIEPIDRYMFDIRWLKKMTYYQYVALDFEFRGGYNRTDSLHLRAIMEYMSPKGIRSLS